MRKITTKVIYVILFSVSVLSLSAQCLIRPVDLNQRIDNSRSIVEGRVIAKNSYWNSNHNRIYTAYTVEVYKIFKGNLVQTEVEVITEGGIVGNDMHLYDPNLEMTIGDVGIFMLESTVYEKNSGSKIPASSTYRAYALSQGFVKYNELEKTASDVFSRYDNITDQLYNRIIQSTGNNFRTVKFFSINENTQRIKSTLAAPVISGFSPTTISAGTKSQLTINGSNFGASMGTSTVLFKDANDGGATYYTTPSTEIVSWGNNQIVVNVPPSAGTGTVQVNVIGEGTGTSAQTLTINYSNLNVNSGGLWVTRMVNDNTSGGYTWNYFTGFDGNSNAKAAFERAFQNWRCATFVNWQVGATTAINVNASEGTNVVRFDIGAELPDGVLGQCASYYTGCAGNNWYVSELDIRFDDGANWYFGTGTPGGTQSDFESVALHELGHGHQQAHVINDGAVMHYAITQGTQNRALSANDLAGGNNIMTRSTGSSICGQGVMSALNSGNCSLTGGSGTGSDYRTKANGNWNNASVWERYDGTSWVAATQTPTNADGMITIRNTDTVTVDTDGIIADQVIVEAGGKLAISSNDFTLNNWTADDLVINGKLTWDNGQLLAQGGSASILIGSGGVADFSALNFLNLDCQLMVATGGVLNLTDGSITMNVPSVITNNGTLNISGYLSIFGFNSSITNNGTMNKTNGGISEFEVLFIQNGTLNVNNGNASFWEIDINTNSVINILGSLDLNGQCTYNGGTIQGPGSLNTTDVLILNGNLTIPSNLPFTNTGIIDGDGDLIINHNFTISGAIYGSGDFIIDGNSFLQDGILGRSLTVASGDTLTIEYGILDSAILTIASGAFLLTLDGGLDLESSASVINNGTIKSTAFWFIYSEEGGSFTNNGSLIKDGVDPFFLAGDSLWVTNSTTGVIKGDYGYIVLLLQDSKYVNKGSISPGTSPGILFFSGNNMLTDSSKLNIEIAGNNGPGNINGHDQIQKYDTIGLVLKGTLNVVESGPVPPGSYSIIETHGDDTTEIITGNFGTVNLPPGYTISRTDTTLILNKVSDSAANSIVNFRSKTNGNWNDVAVWEMFSGGNWIPATLIPSSTHGTITIRNSDTILVNTYGLIVDQLAIDAGGVLDVLNNFILNNGAGEDLVIAGKLSVNSIEIQIQNGNSTIVVNSGGEFKIEGNNSIPSIVFASVTVSSNGVLNWVSENLNIENNALIINNGTVNLGADATLRSPVSGDNNHQFVNNGTINKTSAGLTRFEIDLDNNGIVNVNSGTWESRAFVNNNSASNINLSSGTILKIIGESFYYNGGNIQGLGSINNTDSIVLNNSLTIPANLSFTNTGIIAGNGNLTINQNFTIEGKITGNGALTISGSTVNLNSGGILDRPYNVISGQTFNAITGELKKTVTIDAGGTMIGSGTGINVTAVVLGIRNNGNLNIVNDWTFAGHIENNAIMTRSGTGTFSFGGSFTNNLNGILRGEGVIDFNMLAQFFYNVGTIAPGLSPGILILDGQTPLSTISKLNIEIAGNGGAGQPTGHDQLQRNKTGPDNLVLGGTLYVTETGTVPPGVYTIITQSYGQITGTFSTTNLPAGYTVQYTSQTVTVTKGAGPCIPAVSIAANPGNSICAGTNVTFTATPINGGTTPAYQWKLNGNNVGTNSNTYTSSSLVNGDIISCVMTSNEACANPITATSNSIIMSVTANVTPSVSIAANPDNTICAGTNVTFTATPANGGTPSYQWKLNGNNVGTNSNTYSNTSLANGDIVTCVMTSSITCVTSSTATSNAITMIVTANVTPSVSIAANPGNTICAGTSVTFTATPTNGGTTPDYQWKLNGNNVGTNLNTYTNASLANSDVVTCVMTSSITCVSSATATSNAITMNVTANVTPSVSIAANPGNTICAGTNVTFTSTPANGGTPTYQWKLNGNNVGTNSNTYANSSLVNGDIITCMITSSLGCAVPTNATSNVITMNVTANVTPSVSIVANPGNTICAGTSVTFTATPTNGGATPTYQWKLNGNNVGTNLNTYTNASLANSDVVTCVMTSSITCVTSSTATSNAITMTVNPVFVPSISIAANPGNTICAGTSVTFTATPTNGGTTPVYQWKLNGNNVGTNSNTYANATLANGDIVTCVLTSNAVCPNPVSVTSNAITMTVNDIVSPSVTIAANPGNTICAGTNVTFTATPTNGGVTPTYQWKLNGNNVGTSSNTYSNASLNNNDVVSCVMTSSASCLTVSTATSNSITMTVTGVVVPAVIIAANPGNSICAGTNITFTATPTNGGLSPSYQWKLNGNNVGSNSNTYQNAALVTGDVISCVLTSSFACSNPTTATSNSISMTVTANFTPSVSIAANPGNSICAGTNVTFTATPANGGTPSYQWKLNGNNVGTNSNTYQNSSLANTDVITCVMTSSITCITSATATSNVITMNVTANVTPSVNIAANPRNTICAGVNVTFTATPANGGTPTYQWKLNGNNVGNNSNTYQNSSLANADIITCVMTSSITCVTSATATSNAITMSVTAVVTTSVSIIANPGTTICAGTDVTFTATPANGGATPSYQWKLNGNNVGTNSDTYSNAALNNNDIVTCVLTSSLVCVTAGTVTSNAITITVSGIVTPSVSIAANPGNSICTGANVTFTAAPTNGGSTPSYQWKLNGNNVGTNSNTYQNSGLVTGDVVNCVMTSSLPCANPTPATSNNVTMNVNAVVTPSVSIAAVPGNSICSGVQVTFTATPTNGGSAPSYQWKLNGNNVGTNSNIYQSTTLANGDVVSCVMTSSLVCVTQSTATSNSITMGVTQSVTPSLSIAANPGNTICAGTNVTFTATPTNGGTPSYQWKLNGNNVGTNSNTYSTVALSNGDVLTCEMTSTATCAIPAIVTSNSITMTVNSYVTPAVTIATNTGNTICAGTSVTFTATPVNGGASPAYQWKLNENNVGTNSNTYQNASLANGDVVNCVMTSSLVCLTASTATSNSITITVTSSVTPAVSIAANPGNSICAGTNVTFTASPTNGGATPSYQWKLNGNNAGTNSSTYQNAALANGDVVTCVLTSSEACANPTTATSNTITMSVTANVTPSVSIAANPGNTICAGTSVTFTATTTNGGTPTYQWKLNSNNVGTNSNTYQNASLANGDVVTCVMTSSITCVTSSTANSNAVTMNVTANVTPSVSIVANPGNSICAGTSVTFTATPTNGGASPAYQWKLNGNNIGTNSNSYSNAGPANGDVISCVMTSSLTCVTVSTAASNDITMNVTANVTPSVSIAANPGNIICAGTNVTFTATPTNGGATSSYQWKLNGNNVGANSSTYQNASLPNGGVITCVMTSSITCVTSATTTSNAITMTVNALPAITTHPQSQASFVGANVTFSVTATGAGLTYQWRKNGTNINNATGSSYTINNLALTDAGNFDVVVSGTCLPDVISNVAELTVSTVSISTQPANQAACVGNNANFALVANGTGLTYQWQVSTGGGPFTNITGATGSTLTLNAVTLSMGGNQYRCVVSGSLNSNPAKLTVNPLPVVLLALPFDTLYQNSPVQTLSGGTPSGVTGVYSGIGVGAGLINPGAFQTGNYTVIYRFTDANGCFASASDVFTIISGVDKIKLFPNPAPNGQVTIIAAPELLGGKASVYNEAGQKISEWVISGRQSVHRFKWSAGSYTIFFVKGSIEVSKQIIIIR